MNGKFFLVDPSRMSPWLPLCVYVCACTHARAHVHVCVRLYYYGKIRVDTKSPLSFRVYCFVRCFDVTTHINWFYKFTCLFLEKLYVVGLIWANLKRFTLLKCPILMTNGHNSYCEDYVDWKTRRGLGIAAWNQMPLHTASTVMFPHSFSSLYLG